MRRTLSVALLLSVPLSARACLDHPNRTGYQSEAGMLARLNAYYAGEHEVHDAGAMTTTGLASSDFTGAGIAAAQAAGFAFVTLATLWLRRVSTRRARAADQRRVHSAEFTVVAAELSSLLYDGPSPRRDLPHVVPGGPAIAGRVGECEIRRAMAESAR